MKAVALVDFGSTFTKLTLTEAGTGHLLATAQAPTTVETDVMEGYRAALDSAAARVPGRLDIVRRLAASSAGGGLRLAAIGLVPDYTAAAARQAALSAGARIVLQLSGRLDARVVANVLPAIRRLDIEPARAAIHDEFIRHAIRGKGLSEAQEFHEAVIMPTPEAVLQATELLASGDGGARPGDVVVIDLGGATTDVHAALARRPTPAGIRLAGLPALPLTRTVEGDLGMRWSAPGALEADAAWLAEQGRACGTTPDRLREACALRQREPGFLPDGPEEERVDCALAVACVTHALGRHCGTLGTVYVPGQGTDLVQCGADLRAVPLVIGTGGVLGRHATGESLLRQALERQPQGTLAPRTSALALDRRYVLAAAGLLSTVHAAAARALLAGQGLTASA